MVGMGASLIVLAVVGAFPTLTFTTLSAETIFLCPIAGSLVAALAAVLEVRFGGSLLTWFVVVSIVINAATLAAWCGPIRRRLGGVSVLHGTGADPLRKLLTFAVAGGAALWPLQALRARNIGFDANAIWLLHAILLHGGHASFVAALHNPVYGYSNMDYPPLVPAAGAVGFFVSGGINLHLGIGITALLNSCGTAILGCGVARLMPETRQWWRVAVAVICAGSICLICFGVAGQYGVTGYADLTWAALAVSAAVYGLVLPANAHNFRVAWLCATAAALTKNEGFAVGLAILVLVLIRSTSSTVMPHYVLRLARRVPWILPSLSWTIVMYSFGVHDAFFQGGAPSETPFSRISPTLNAAWTYLHIGPVAVLVALVGAAFLRPTLSSISAANPAWFWAALAIGLGLLFGTYIFGSLEIHYWLGSSISRTMIFPQIALYAELAIWLMVAASPSHHGRQADGPTTPFPRRAESTEAQTGRRTRLGEV